MLLWLVGCPGSTEILPPQAFPEASIAYGDSRPPRPGDDAQPDAPHDGTALGDGASRTDGAPADGRRPDARARDARLPDARPPDTRPDPCAPGAPCTAGQTEEGAPQGCGRCGTQRPKRQCSATCTWGAWAPGTCGGEGPCDPGDTRTTGCDTCARKVCGQNCQWGGCTLKPGAQCEWRAGAHFRCCAADRWEYCLPSCVWSGNCAYCGSNCPEC
ncbi:MAG: hypothetical protein IT371_08770 [Deltaproteobacteria bacterium]|nr:hypothetical protein [Deltaproteobacteria bacterium]